MAGASVPSGASRAQPSRCNLSATRVTQMSRSLPCATSAQRSCEMAAKRPLARTRRDSSVGRACPRSSNPYTPRPFSRRNASRCRELVSPGPSLRTGSLRLHDRKKHRTGSSTPTPHPSTRSERGQHEHESRHLRSQARHDAVLHATTATSSASPSSRRAGHGRRQAHEVRRTATPPSSSASASARRSTRASRSRASSRRPTSRRSAPSARSAAPRSSSRKYEVGQTIKLDELFKPGQFVDAQGKTRGRGFTGVMRRWSFAGGVGVARDARVLPPRRVDRYEHDAGSHAPEPQDAGAVRQRDRQHPEPEDRAGRRREAPPP